MIKRELFILFFILASLFLLIGCDTLSENYSDKEEVKGNVSLSPSIEKSYLMDILQSQEGLISDLSNAAEYGEKQSIKELYEEILLLDQRYQEEFEKFGEELSPSDSREISQKHYEIIKRLPSYSSLMK